MQQKFRMDLVLHKRQVISVWNNFFSNEIVYILRSKPPKVWLNLFLSMRLRRCFGSVSIHQAIESVLPKIECKLLLGHHLTTVYHRLGWSQCLGRNSHLQPPNSIWNNTKKNENVMRIKWDNFRFRIYFYIKGCHFCSIFPNIVAWNAATFPKAFTNRNVANFNSVNQKLYSFIIPYQFILVETVIKSAWIVYGICWR